MASLLALLVVLAMVIVWRITRVACRKFGLGENSQLIIAFGCCFVTLAAWIGFHLDRLDVLETDCRSGFSKSEGMAGTSRLAVDQHYDFWTKTYSGSWAAGGWLNRPYQDPRVLMLIRFTRDGAIHDSWIECLFDKVPDSGDPPAVVLKQVRPYGEQVLNDKMRWVPWLKGIGGVAP